MPDWSRRRALHAVGTAAAVALAGCTAERDPPDPPSQRRGTPVTDYDMVTVRKSDETSLFWRGEQESDDRREGVGRAYLRSASDVEELSFAPDSEAAGELSSFAAATDFDSRSVYLQSRPVASCYEPEFRGVWRQDDGVETSFCRRLLPADEPCRREEETTFGIGLRLPFPDEEFTSFGSQWSGDCQPTPVGFDGADDASSGGDGDD